MVSLRKYVIGTAVAAICYGMISFIMPKKLPTIEDRINDFTTVRVVEGLQQNDNDLVTLLVKKNEFDGTKDIEALIPKATSEESFAYLPEEKVWVEIGRGTSHARIDGNITSEGIYLDDRIIQVIARNYAFAVYSHIHRPVRKIKNEPPKIIKYISPQQLQAELKKIWEETLYETLVLSPQLTLPSVADSVSAIAILFMHHDENPKGKAFFRIYNEYGVTEYSIKPEGFNAFKNMDDDTITSRVTEIITQMRDSYVVTREEAVAGHETSSLFLLTTDITTKRSTMSRILDDNYFRITYFSYPAVYAKASSDSVK